MDERQLNIALAKKERLLMDVPKAGDIGVVLAYPNRYWVAMSNLGFQTVYKLLSDEKRLRVERAFLPESAESDCRTFEANRPLSNSGMLALSVSFETDYPHVLRMLEAAGVNLERRLHGGLAEAFDTAGPFILGGGAALTLNPEPLAPFFDAIVIGEGEEVLPEILRAFIGCREARGNRKDLLSRMAQIDGVYVPAFYQPQFAANGTVAKYVRHDGSSERVKRRFVDDIDRFSTRTIIQTPETEFKAMYMAETGRGCEVGCKFCVAGYMYRPVRKRSEESLRATLQVGLENSESIGFVGAAVSSHPAIAELAKSVAREGKRAALSSIMSQRVTRELAGSLSESEYKTVALAPEAGSEELRFRVGKRVRDQQIVEAVATLAENGIRHFKLYFIVGLPAEAECDVESIPRLVMRIQEAALEAARRQEEFREAPTILLSVNPFIPKAWTPFQRHPFLPVKEIKRRLEVVRQGIRRLPNVEMKAESPRESYFQALVSRGDRRVGEILYAMHRLGHDWRWLVLHGNEVIVEGVPPPSFFVERLMGKDELLPWESVDLLIKRSLLEREYERTFSDDVQGLIARSERARSEQIVDGIALRG